MGGQMLSTTTASRGDQHPSPVSSPIRAHPATTLLPPRCHLAATPISGSDDAESRTMVTRMSTFHDFEMTSITGDQVSFDRFEDQICLIVNVASA